MAVVPLKILEGNNSHSNFALVSLLSILSFSIMWQLMYGLVVLLVAVLTAGDVCGPSCERYLASGLAESSMPRWPASSTRWRPGKGVQRVASDRTPATSTARSGIR